MAPLAHANQKRELARQLEAARLQLGASLHGFKGDLDVGSHVRGTLHRHPTVWMGGAAVLGWVIARLGRGRRVKALNPGERKKLASLKKTGWILGFLKLAFSLLRPTLMAYASKKFADLGASTERAAKTSKHAADVSKEAVTIARDRRVG